MSISPSSWRSTASADVYLSMSEHEGFGVPLLEAFYNRIPVIGYAAGAVEETMNGGGVTLYEKDFLKTAALIDRIQRDEALKDQNHRRASSRPWRNTAGKTSAASCSSTWRGSGAA